MFVPESQMTMCFSSRVFSFVRNGICAAVGGEGQKSPKEADDVCGHSAAVQPHGTTGEY